MSGAPGFRPLQLLTLTALLATVALVSLQRKLSVLGADIGWHLKVGDWIVQHRAFPHNGIFSRTAATRPWVAYSWGYEILLSRANAWFGLVGVALYGTLLTLMVVFSVFWMARRLSGRFWPACLLTVVCCYSFLLFRIAPRPSFFSIALFCVVLTLLFEARRTGRVQSLYCLPLIFLLWANLHIQFSYGLAVVGLLLAINLVQHLAEHLGHAPNYITPRSLPSAPLATIFALCVLATMIGPYGYHLYGVILRYSQAKVPYAMVQELQSFHLRFYGNYLQILLAAAAFLIIGWQKKIDVFKLAVLAIATVLAFRTMRDAWFQCTAAAACIADIVWANDEAETAETPAQLAGVFAVVALVVLLGARAVDFNQRGLQRAMAAIFPLDAANFLRQNPAPGPLWSPFDWGGFLIWYLPQYPVGIDGRTDLYGDELVERFYKTASGDATYRTDPYLNDSGVVLLRRRDGLAPLLENDPLFQKVYEDKIASVFVRQPGHLFPNQ